MFEDGSQNANDEEVTRRADPAGIYRYLVARRPTDSSNGLAQTDSWVRFLTEAILLSVTGGLTKAPTRVSDGGLIGSVTPFQPLISLTAVMVARSVSSEIGLFWGVMPTRQAVELDPIVALRRT